MFFSNLFACSSLQWLIDSTDHVEEMHYFVCSDNNPTLHFPILSIYSGLRYLKWITVTAYTHNCIHQFDLQSHSVNLTNNH